MKRKNLLITIGILIILLLVMLITYFFYSNNISKRERTKLIYITGTLTYDEALKSGKQAFSNTINLIANNYLDFEKGDTSDYKLYLINNIDGYVKINNYNIIKSFLTEKSINTYNNLYGYINYEGYDYIKNYATTIDTTYVGSMIDITYSNETNVTFSTVNYYCSDGSYQGVLEIEPTCTITKKVESSFNMVNEDNILKINNLNEFLDTKKVY